MEDFLGFVGDVERAHPQWSKQDVLAALTNASYDSEKFQYLYNDARKNLRLSAEQEVKAKSYLSHGASGVGSVRDLFEDPVAVGHALTGLRGALSPKNFPLDNAMALSLSGDIGQNAYIAKKHGKSVLIGEKSELDLSELRGDLDALHLAYLISDKAAPNSIRWTWRDKGTKLSDVLTDYYSNYAAYRYDFADEHLDPAEVVGQSKRFAKLYSWNPTDRYSGGVDETSSQVWQYIRANKLRTSAK